MENLERETRDKLLQIGWFPGRDVADTVLQWEETLAEFVSFDVARTVLSEIGGLRLDEWGAGLDAARSKFDLNPARALGERMRFADFEKDIGLRLYPLGEIDDGAAFLAIAEDGRIYAMEQALWYAGDDIWDALDRFIRGRKMPMIVDYPRDRDEAPSD